MIDEKQRDIFFLEFKEKVHEIHNNKYEPIREGYLLTTKPVRMFCYKHGEYSARGIGVLNSQFGMCEECRRDSNFDLFVKNSKSIHGNKYKYFREHYLDSHKPTEILCPVHGVFKQTPAGHYHQKQECPTCTIENNRLTNFKSFLLKVSKKWKDRYKVISDPSEYKTLSSPLRCLCSEHGEYKIPNANTLLVATYAGCKECERLAEADNFIKKAKILHGEKYSYYKENYIDSRHLTDILCNTHNEIFKQRPSAHLQGQNCPLCGKESSIINSTKDNEVFIKQVISKFGDTYDLSLVNYTGAFNKIKVICKQHGIFEATPNNLLIGRGCVSCSKEAKRLALEKEFPIKANKVHKGKYDYSFVKYRTNRTPVDIMCLRHNTMFKLSPNKHLNGSGCPLCGKELMSRWNISAIMKNIDLFNTKEGYCYLFKIEDAGVIYHKIGFTSFKLLSKRLNMIIKESPTSTCSVVSYRKTSLPNAIRLEKILHKILDTKRVQDTHLTFGGKTELFTLDNEDVNSVVSFFETFKEASLVGYVSNKIPSNILKDASSYFKK